MNVAFERAAAADAEGLTKAQVAAFDADSRLHLGVERGGPPGYDSVETTLQKIQEADFYKIVYEGRIIGGIVVLNPGQGHFHLDVICLEPEYQNRGIGTQALQFLDAAYPAAKWTLHTPDFAVRNQHLYEKFGYVKVGEEPADGFILFAYSRG